MKTRFVAATLLALTAASCAGAQACSSAPPTPPGHAGSPPPGVQTPLTPPLPESTAPLPPSVVEPITSAPLDLSAYAPLLSGPDLSEVREACKTRSDSGCALRLALYLERTEIHPLDMPRWQLLLGTAYEDAGLFDDARNAYRRSSSGAWPLWDYAVLGLARVLHEAGDPESARVQLERIGPGTATYTRAKLLLAELACEKGSTGSCIEHLEEFLRRPHKPSGWASRSFRVCETLVKLLSLPRSHRSAIENQLKALSLVRRLANLAPGTAQRFDSAKLERELLLALPEEDRVKLQQLSARQQLERAEAQAAGGRHDDAEQSADALLTQLGGRKFGPIACQAMLLRGKSLARLRRRSEATTLFESVIAHCKTEDLRAWSLYLLGKYAFQDDRYPETERWMAQLEREAPRHRLADDGRLYRAQAQHEMGVDARFSQLLTTMPDDYPKGDMTLDGVFVLALSRMERGDWAGASGVLDRAVAMVGAHDVDRGPEWSGRERYFQARALVETGNLEAGLQQYATLVQHYPLSYYMLHAFTQLWRHDAPRAKATLEQALEQAKAVPFAMGQPEQFAQAEVLRVMELFRQGDADSARRELQINGLLRKSKASAVLWGIAQLYQTAGSDRYSHAVPRWQLTDWLSHWPAGQWAHGWQLAFPRPYLESVTQQAAARGVEPQLIYAVMREESAFHAEAVSPANAYGLMQVIPPTARHFGSQSGTPHDKNALVQPEVSITLGSHVLSSYGGRFPDDPLLAIPAYNAGPGRPLRWMAERPQLPFDLWVELIPYRETRRYTKRVLASRAAYAFLYYEPDPLAALRLPLGLAGASRGSSASD